MAKLNYKISITDAFIVTFDQFNASLLNKSIDI